MQVSNSSTTILTDKALEEQNYNEIKGDEISDSSISNPQELVDSEEDDQNDDIQLWGDGWYRYYYEKKLKIDLNDLENYSTQLVQDYTQGLCWILQYDYKGVPSWDWYYPHYYVPFASDFSKLENVIPIFSKNSKPLLPLQQMLATFPPQYANYLPKSWQYLMLDKEKSSIIDFYPINFTIDRNCKRQKWQGVVLLPFVDEDRLLKALKPVDSSLTIEERKRNKHDYDRLFIHKKNPCFLQLRRFYYDNINRKIPIISGNSTQLSAQYSGGMTGQVWPDDIEKFQFIDSTIQTPSPIYGPIIKANQILSVKYRNL